MEDRKQIENALLRCIEQASAFNTSAPAISEPDETGKRHFAGWRNHDHAPTIEDIRAHLDGKCRLHVPTTSRWCQIDVDHAVSDDGLIQICQRLDSSALASTPVVTRSKSGGAHIDLLLIEDVDTEAATKALVKFLKFPKTVKVEQFNSSTAQRATFPYFGMERGIWYAPDGEKLRLTTHSPRLPTCPKWRIEDLTNEPLPATRLNGEPRIPVDETSRRKLVRSVLGSARRLGWVEDEMKEYIYRMDKARFDGHRAYDGKPAIQNDAKYKDDAPERGGKKDLNRLIRDMAEKPTGTAPDPQLDKVLERFAYLAASDTGCIVDLERWARGEREPFLKKTTFEELYCNKFTVRGDQVGKAFMHHPRRKTLGGFKLDPSTSDMILDVGDEFPYLNLFRGWGVKPEAGDVRPWRRLLALVSGGNRAWIRQFDAAMAQMFQEPGNVKERPKIAFMVSGLAGTGKSSISETIKDIVGPDHSLEIQSAAELFPEGGFNEHQLGKIFMMIEEAIFGKSHVLMNKLKTRITGATVSIHPKFRGRYDVDNIQRLFATTNDTHSLSLTAEDRRWTAIESQAMRRFDMMTPEGRAEAKAWFDAYHEWRRDGGMGAILHHYLNMKIDRDALAHPIETETKKRQVQHSLTPVQRWALEVAERGFLPDDGTSVGFATPMALRHEIKTVTGKFDTEVFQPKIAIETDIPGLELKPGPVVRLENEYTGKSQSVRTVAFPPLLEFRMLVQRVTGFDNWDDQAHWRSPDGDPIRDEAEWVRVMRRKVDEVEMFGAKATAEGKSPI